MKFCSQCGYASEAGVSSCVRCGFRFALAPLPQTKREFPTVFLIVLLLSATAVAAKLAMARVNLDQLRTRLTIELRQSDQLHEQEFNARRDAEARGVAAEEAAHST